MTINLGSDVLIKGINDATIPSNDMCSKIFETTDYNKLGTGNPLCNVNPNNNKVLIIQFANNAKMTVGTVVKLKGG